MGSPVVEGEILAEKYRVERVLGQGGMGVVVAARHVELDELVALKFLLPDALGEPEAVERFLREARASVRIKSEHVARVHDVGQLESGAPYIVMEYLEGSDLAAVLRARGPLPVDDVVDYVAQACEALAEAHAMGIVHRDLKPSNLMLVLRSDGSECVKVLDFGISKVMSRSGGSMNMTRSATVLGSPFYMSPEQMMSPRDVDGRTDIWALGVIVYELLTAKVPFEADTLPGVSVLIATADPVPIGQLRPDVHPALEAVATMCLAKNREDRYANVGEMAAALAPFAPPRAQVSIARAARILASAGSRRSDGFSAVDASGRALTPRGGGGPLTPPGRPYTPPGRALTPREHPQTPRGLGLTPPGAPRDSDFNRTMTAGHVRSSATASNWAGTSPGRHSRRRFLVIGSVALAACLLVAFFVARRGESPAPAAVAPPPSAVHPAPTPAPTEAPTPLPALHEDEPDLSSVRAAVPEAGTLVERSPGKTAPALRPRPAAPGTHPAAVHPPSDAPVPEKKSTYEDM